MTAPNASVHFSSERQDWGTPADLFARLDAEFHFTIDVASSHENAKCVAHFTIDDDGLSQDWGRCVAWMNPPYGREIGKWMQKAHDASLAGATVVCLVPARTDTAWWHNYAMRAHERRFLRGRVRFKRGGQATGDLVATGASAPFPSAIVVFRPVVR